MHILNITFSVDPSVEEGFVSAVQQQIIPKLDHKSSLLRIHSDANTHPTFGLQIEFESVTAIHDFKCTALDSIYQQLQTSFPNKWVSFDTELEKLTP
tara:strand:- start:1140 stop:1430 length:291 start_codon:yes stop_codon:yes gene_type:complete